METAKWFNKSGFSRFFNSFNKAVIDEHNNAITVINRSVDIVTERGQVEGLLRLEDVRLTSDIVEWKVDVLSENVDSRLANLEVNFEALVDEFRLHNHYQRQDRLEAGSLMLGLLLEQMETWGWERIGTFTYCHLQEAIQLTDRIRPRVKRLSDIARRRSDSGGS